MHQFVFGVAVTAACVAAWGAVRADEEKVAIDKLPKAVGDAINARFDGAQMVNASKETADGHTLFEVTLKHKGRAVDVTTTPDGKIIEVETEMPANDAPAAVAAALKQKYPGGKVTRSEEVAKMNYEFLVKSGDKLTEVVVDPFGKVVKEEDKTNDKDP